METFDITIVGGGILGTSLAFWLSLLFEGKIAVLEMERDVAKHTSGRNTGVIHRPFYLDPDKRKTFAHCAQISYGLWKAFAQNKNLPWSEIGTIEVAVDERQLNILGKYADWALKNGMQPEEIELLNGSEVKKIEPHVHCLGAIYSKTDTSVNYELFTRALKEEAVANGIQFLFRRKVKEIRLRESRIQIGSDNMEEVESRFLINCAGGNAVDLAHLFKVGLEYTDLHFRGEYWEVRPEKAGLVTRNIYTVPKHPTIPFLDPHWIVRADGRREIGPNAVLVTGCTTYEGFFSSLGELASKIFEKPLKNKLSLFVNPDFLKLASEEWYSSISKKAMAHRVQKFIPDLRVEDLYRKGTSGIRSSVIDLNGNFVKEAIEIPGPSSYHILNYNSPGATGSPAYTASLVEQLEKSGALNHLKKRPQPLKSLWNYSEVVQSL